MEKSEDQTCATSCHRLHCAGLRGDPERQRTALLEALFKLAPKGRFFKVERQLGLRSTTGQVNSCIPLSRGTQQQGG